jgi:signal transduction histidine kinase
MEAIGTLAGGIAHDFNNMLSAIIGYTELARNDLPEGSRASMNLDQVLKAGMRARELVNQILSFSRNFETESEGVKVALVMNEALKLLRVTIPTTIDIRDNIECETESVFADPTQIHQIIMNLCTNAYQAMEKGGGILSVGLEPVEMNDMEISDADNLQLAGGPYLKLTVSDTGCGMDEETARNIFDPFFTTKERGKGTGLGLATVHRIVTELKGSIMVESAPGRGTTFVIYLPRIVETN